MRALVCSGGGSLGAWQGGAIQALADAGRNWTVFSGVSVGSLNAAYMSQSKYSCHQAEALKRLWFNVKGNSDVYKPHAPWFLKWVWQLWKRSLYTMMPLQEMVEKNYCVDATIDEGNVLLVGTTNLVTGYYYSWNIEGSPSIASKIIHASSVFPGLFEPVQLSKGGDLYIDGGVRNAIPVADVLDYHLVGGEVTEVDVVLTSPRDRLIHKKPEDLKSGVAVGFHAAQILANEVYMTDLEVIHRDDVQINIYEPRLGLNQDPFEFDPARIRELWHLGYQETSRGLKK